jgi:hypothetical protein
MLASQGLPSLEEGLTKVCLGLGYGMLASQGLPSLEEGVTKLCLGLGYKPKHIFVSPSSR